MAAEHKEMQTQTNAASCVCYLWHTAAGVGVAWCVVAEGRQAGQDEVDGANLQSHAAQQHAVVGGQRRAAEQSSQHMEGQRGQHVGRRRLKDVTCSKKPEPINTQHKAGEVGTVATGWLDGGGDKFVDTRCICDLMMENISYKSVYVLGNLRQCTSVPPCCMSAVPFSS